MSAARLGSPIARAAFAAVLGGDRQRAARVYDALEAGRVVIRRDKISVNPAEPWRVLYPSGRVRAVESFAAALAAAREAAADDEPTD